MDCAVKHPEIWRELQNARLAYKRAILRPDEFRDDEFGRAAERLRQAQASARAAGFIFRPRQSSFNPA